MAKPNPPATWLRKSTQGSISEGQLVPSGSFRLRPSTVSGLVLATLEEKREERKKEKAVVLLGNLQRFGVGGVAVEVLRL